MHDANGNGQVDRNWLGMPTEGWAVSNNVIHRMRAPRFDECTTALTQARPITLTMRY